MKKTFAFLILAVLVLAAFPAFTFPNVNASASEAKVQSYSWYTAPANPILAARQGDLVVVGEVQNVGSNIIQNVTLTGTAFSSNGTELGSSQGIAFVYETAPGEKAPFSIDFPPSSSTTSNQNWASLVTNVTVTVLSVTDTSTAPYTGLQVPEAPYALNLSGTYTTGGTIINNGTETIGYVWVVTTYYDSSGTVVALNLTNYINTPSALLYHNYPARWVATPADNTIALTNEIATSAYVIDSMPYTSSEPTSTPTPTGSKSSSSFPLLPVIIVVVVIVVVVAVVALMLFRKRPEAPPPPPPPPPEDAEQPNP